jgi:divalent metal cation (Fe/Co/Zn/Cd) transporter
MLLHHYRYSNKHHPDYPIGRSRLEAISVLATASIMSMASVEIIQYSVSDIYAGFTGNIPQIHTDAVMYSILGIGIGLKLALYAYCKFIYEQTRSDTLGALAEDHLNDVMSNTAALITAAVATSSTEMWWFDPVGAIVISLIIMYRWWSIIQDQVKKIVGFTAPPEFIDKVRSEYPK